MAIHIPAPSRVEAAGNKPKLTDVLVDQLGLVARRLDAGRCRNMDRHVDSLRR